MHCNTPLKAVHILQNNRHHFHYTADEIQSHLIGHWTNIGWNWHFVLHSCNHQCITLPWVRCMCSAPGWFKRHVWPSNPVTHIIMHPKRLQVFLIIQISNVTMCVHGLVSREVDEHKCRMRGIRNTSCTAGRFFLKFGCVCNTIHFQACRTQSFAVNAILCLFWC